MGIALVCLSRTAFSLSVFLPCQQGLLNINFFVLFYANEATLRVAINSRTTVAIIIDFGSRLVAP